jgi:hypothetical protein
VVHVATLFVLVAGLGLGTAIHSTEGLPKRFDLFSPEPPYVAVLRSGQANHLFRMLAVDGVLQPNFAAAFGVSSIDGYEGTTPIATGRFLKELLDRNSNGLFFGMTFSGSDFANEFRANRKFFDLVGVKHITSLDTDLTHVATGDSALRSVLEEPTLGLHVWENPQALPRAFFARRAVPVASASEAIAAMRAAPDLRDTVWLEQPGAGQLGVPSVLPAGTDSGELLGFELLPNDVSIAYRAPGPGILVLSDSYSPGWTATVNQQPASIFRVDAALRGVQLPSAGDYRISMRYRPPHWNTILLLVALGALLVSFSTASGFRCRHHPDRPSRNSPEIARATNTAH